MRCAYESQLDHLTIFPFPGLKIVNIRGKKKISKVSCSFNGYFSGNALLTLDLIIINHFVSRLQSDNQLLELSLRDQVYYSLTLISTLPSLYFWIIFLQRKEVCQFPF